MHASCKGNWNKLWPFGSLAHVYLYLEMILHVIMPTLLEFPAISWKEDKSPGIQWVVPEKIHTPPTDGILEILAGGGGIQIKRLVR